MYEFGGLFRLKCPKCGNESNKTKLTLSVDKTLIQKAKDKGINLSQVMTEALQNL